MLEKRAIQKTHLLLLVVVVLLLLVVALGGCSNPQLLHEGTHKLCGQSLNDAVDSVCVNGYNTIPKKRADGDVSAALELAPAVVAGYARSPLLSSFYGTEVLVKTRRLRRQGGGIHDECCINSCTYQELLAYCRQ